MHFPKIATTYTKNHYIYNKKSPPVIGGDLMFIWF